LDGYAKEVEVKMQRLFATLSEKDRRRYAGIEAAKLGHGGIEYISGLFQIDPKTVRRGLLELEQTDAPAASRVRKKRRRAQSGDGTAATVGEQLPPHSR
jgi:hypothetical protein